LRDPTRVSLIRTAICGGSGYRVPYGGFAD
jgi:hypothetical protein